MTGGALTVSQLNSYIKTLMSGDDFLSSVTLRGEISNFKAHSSGHLYFTLKDERSEIQSVMFNGRAQTLKFRPQNGMKVTVYGQVSVYEAAGRYQIYVNAMVNDGAGALYEQYRLLLEKLKAEGLFDEGRKKPLPKFPKRIGIVTSPTGAAVRDMINVTGRRYPSAEVLICPALVQGAEAPADLCRALSLIDTLGECDVIIIGRGGGSAEDLWAFNDEMLVRAVAACNTPIISAVGHETDTTLCDFAADMRAPTPSTAAEMAVPDRISLLHHIDGRGERLDKEMDKLVENYRLRITSAARHVEATSPTARLGAMRREVNAAARLIGVRLDSAIEGKKAMLSGYVSRLEDVNPLAVLKRGYSMTLDGKGVVVTKKAQLALGDDVSVIVSDGCIKARVEEIK